MNDGKKSNPTSDTLVAAEAALNEASQRAQALLVERDAILAQLAEGVIITDSAGRIIFVNEAAHRLHGVKRLDVPPEDYTKTYHLFTEDGDPYPPEELPLARAVMRGEQVDNARWRIRRPDGEEMLAIGSARPVRGVTGEAVGAVLTFRDDTSRDAAERALRDSESLKAAILQSALDSIIVIDEDSRIVEFNPAAERVFGYPREAVIGQSMAELIMPPEHRENHYRGLAHYLATGEGPLLGKRVEITAMRADGSIFPVELAIIRSDVKGKPLFTGYLRDITKRKAAEAALREWNETLERRVAEEVAERGKAEEQLRQAQKMEAIGHLTGGVAHDFNNLLTIVVGNIDSLQRHMPSGAPDRLRRSAENAMQGARRAATLTQRLLAFSRRQPLEPKPIEVNRLVSGMSDMLSRTLGETVEVQTVLAGGLWQVEVDPNQLESALLNLAVNARDAMPAGGKLTIETANAYLDEAYAAKEAEVLSGQYIVLAVSDTGTGMSREILEHAFEPFFTTKPTGHGTGLGLPQVYGFVKQSGGHVKIYSEPGEGTTVRIYLPRFVGVIADADILPSTVPDGHRDETLLVVEDDEDVRKYAAEILRELGYRVIEAHDAATALRQLERHESIDLLLTDIGLPGMNGRELADEARKRRPGLKVLFTTGYARNAIVHHGRLDPGVQMIGKPFTYADLAAKVRSVIDSEAERDR